ncbi:MAG: thioesterase family protein [Proteobacteria bacterium]|nr:thioesterase family protein [Pseudomonadota bacterium]
MSIDAPLALYETTVKPEWLDVNDHMNVAYYVLAFDQATDALFSFVGVGEAYIEARACTMFALECHVTYDAELRGGDPIRISTQLLGFDAKKMHFCHQMYHIGDGRLAAASEWMGIHIDMESRRSAGFPNDIAQRLGEIRDAHAGLPTPPGVGRVISLKAGRPR